MEWVIAIQDKERALTLARELSAEFPFKTTAVWFSILTMIEYVEEMKK